MTDALQEALRQIQAQIAEAVQQRDRLNIRIVQLQGTELGLKNALGLQQQAETAWTELVLAALNSQPGQAMSAVEIRDVLNGWGYMFQGIRNPLGFINTCLQRMAERGLIRRSPRGRPFKFTRA